MCAAWIEEHRDCPAEAADRTGGLMSADSYPRKMAGEGRRRPLRCGEGRGKNYGNELQRMKLFLATLEGVPAEEGNSFLVHLQTWFGGGALHDFNLIAGTIAAPAPWLNGNPGNPVADDWGGTAPPPLTTPVKILILRLQSLLCGVPRELGGGVLQHLHLPEHLPEVGRSDPPPTGPPIQPCLPFPLGRAQRHRHAGGRHAPHRSTAFAGRGAAVPPGRGQASF